MFNGCALYGKGFHVVLLYFHFQGMEILMERVFEKNLNSSKKSLKKKKKSLEIKSSYFKAAKIYKIFRNCL